MGHPDVDANHDADANHHHHDADADANPWRRIFVMRRVCFRQSRWSRGLGTQVPLSVYVDQPTVTPRLPNELHSRPSRKRVRAQSSTSISWSCPHCSTVCRYPSELDRHVRMVHLKLRPWTCDQCQATFTEKTSLQRHQTSHQSTNERFKCDLCDAGYRRRETLLLHLKTVHAQHRDAVCPHPGCAQSFARACDLERHVRRHVVVRPLECESCGARFQRTDELQRHRATGGTACARVQRRQPRHTVFTRCDPWVPRFDGTSAAPLGASSSSASAAANAVADPAQSITLAPSLLATTTDPLRVSPGRPPSGTGMLVAPPVMAAVPSSVMMTGAVQLPCPNIDGVPHLNLDWLDEMADGTDTSHRRFHSHMVENFAQ